MSSKADRIMAAVVTAKDEDRPDLSRESPHGPDFSTTTDSQSKELWVRRLDPGDLLSDPVPVVSLDRRVQTQPGFEQRLDFHIIRGGEARGVALWIDPDPAGSIRVENDTGAEASQEIMLDRRHVLFFWPAFVHLTPGDHVRVNLRTKLLAEEQNWYWDSLIRKLESGKIQGIRFQQSTASPLPFLNGKRE